MSNKISGPVDVVTVHNTVGKVKPIWISSNGKKYKIDKINSTYQVGVLTVYHCVINGTMVTLHFDGAKWWADQ